MNHFMDLYPRLIKERNERIRQEVRSVRLAKALRENSHRERKEERAGMKGTIGGFLGRIPTPTPATAVVALLALLIAASGTAIAAGSFTASDGTITACRDNKTGGLRVIQSGQSCTSKETTVTWKDGITGKVADSAKLDGKDASAFLGANQKAADAARADSADHATTADSATNADSAGDADTLDGHDSTEFVSGTGTMTPVDLQFNQRSPQGLSVPGAHIRVMCWEGNASTSVQPTSDVNSVRLWRDDGGEDPTATILSSDDRWSTDDSPPSAADRVIWQGTSSAGTFTAVLFTRDNTSGSNCNVSGYVLSAEKVAAPDPNPDDGSNGGGGIIPGGNA